MGSSSNDDYSEMPASPPPPANMISGYGQSTPSQPHFTNFLTGNGPYTGLTPQMLAEIAGSNGPAPGNPGHSTGGGTMDSGGGMQPPRDPRVALAAAMAALPKGQGNITMQGGGAAPRWAEGSPGGNRGGYSTSGRGGTGGFGAHSSSANRGMFG